MNLSSSKTEELYKQYAHLIFLKCKRYLRSEDEAWDATQEVFLKLISKYETIHEEQAILGWLYRTATNHCIDKLRKKSTIEFFEETQPDSSWGNRQDKNLILKTLVEKLMYPWNKKMREVVSLAYIEGYKLQEIADTLGMGESTVRKYLAQFKARSQEWRLEFKEALHDT